MVVCLIDTPYPSSIGLPISPFTSTVVVHKIVSMIIYVRLYYKIHGSHLMYVFSLTLLLTIWEDGKLILSLHNCFVNEC